MSVRYAILASTLLLSTTAADAADMQITPGMWEVQITSKMPMLPQPTVKSMQHCFTASRLSPDEIMQNANNCEFSDVQASSSQVSWKMACTGHGGNMTGTGHFESQGDTMNGTLQMSMEMQGQQITMDHQWSGKRIGECK
ncbi:DUF3617 family protein [Sedimenticola selenatireducens]|uniref:DUF3617 family protein n=1 Tax=Sedimenticola selenatireducens TaxID=191960 RepID=A0A2N6CZ52_9GAMM|nr:DUF3617 family protein [Sedimenticola selenatireducens]PLX62645.1 MAG: hypothetical protein C0630_05410 [Sedimenticola selenatireducens]